MPGKRRKALEQLSQRVRYIQSVVSTWADQPDGSQDQGFDELLFSHLNKAADEAREVRDEA